jgi:hypothetical protein
MPRAAVHTGEPRRVPQSVVALSCLLGMGLSLTASMLNKRISATSQMAKPDPTAPTQNPEP